MEDKPANDFQKALESDNYEIEIKQEVIDEPHEENFGAKVIEFMEDGNRVKFEIKIKDEKGVETDSQLHQFE